MTTAHYIGNTICLMAAIILDWLKGTLVAIMVYHLADWQGATLYLDIF